MVVGDSALVRSLLSDSINRQRDMRCEGTANDPLAARELIRALSPDLLVLDLEMPRLDGIAFLSRLLDLHPIPVVVLASSTSRGADLTLRALELGAFDFAVKPGEGLAGGLRDFSEQVVNKVRIAAFASTQSDLAHAVTEMLIPTRVGPSLESSGSVCAGSLLDRRMIFVGASTGGTEAIRQVLKPLPCDTPPIMIALHMPAAFTSSFALRMDAICQVVVEEAVNGRKILPGHAYVAPGGGQLRVGVSGDDYVSVVERGDSGHAGVPCVEILFESATTSVGRNAIGIMLTGAGSDGAQAMRKMKNVGAYNFVQDQASCAVFGMPRAAILQGAASEVLPLEGIAPALLTRLRSVT